ncbi:hypothetical protein ACFO5K_04365 [Nocardia halotolerans]|uniref:CHY-type domain-containing protein n=1 Tax=Nocardia halotolerans TaxID=1755878 RepID=A0ABV8VDB1_9NOCA
MRILRRKHRDPIAHLDFHPTCDAHNGTCDRVAKYVVHLHGCENSLLCETCLADDLEWADGMPTIECYHCGREAESFQELATVSPL